jgi:hypothetical protein
MRRLRVTAAEVVVSDTLALRDNKTAIADTIVVKLRDGADSITTDHKPSSA